MISKIIYLQFIGMIITGIVTGQKKPFTITGSIKGPQEKRAGGDYVLPWILVSLLQ